MSIYRGLKYSLYKWFSSLLPSADCTQYSSWLLSLRLQSPSLSRISLSHARRLIASWMLIEYTERNQPIPYNICFNLYSLFHIISLSSVLCLHGIPNLHTGLTVLIMWSYTAENPLSLALFSKGKD